MGLLLFWGIPGEAPVVVNTDGGVKPKINFITDKKTQQLFVERTNAVADLTTVTYNDSSTTYSSATQTYGGSDRIQSRGPSRILVQNNDNPKLYFVKGNAIFGGFLLTEDGYYLLQENGDKILLEQHSDGKPQISTLQRTHAVADLTTTTYNDASTTYSSSTQTYGGSDRIVDPPPKIVKIGS